MTKEELKMKQKKVKLTNRIATKLLLMAIIPIIVMAIVLGVYSCSVLRKGVSEEAIEVL